MSEILSTTNTKDQNKYSTPENRTPMTNQLGIQQAQSLFAGAILHVNNLTFTLTKMPPRTLLLHQQRNPNKQLKMINFQFQNSVTASCIFIANKPLLT